MNPLKRERLHLETPDPELARSDAEILAAHPPAQVAAEVRRRARARRAVQVAPLLVAAAVLAVAVWPTAPVAPELAELEPTTIKGDLRLLVHRLGDDRPLVDGDDAESGETLQLRYVSAGHQHAVAFSVDGAGTVTPHPLGTFQAGTHAFPDSYELDDAPAFERFFLVADDAPIDPDPLYAAARDLGPDRPLPTELDWTSVTLEKP